MNQKEGFFAGSDALADEINALMLNKLIGTCLEALLNVVHTVAATDPLCARSAIHELRKLADAIQEELDSGEISEREPNES